MKTTIKKSLKKSLNRRITEYFLIILALTIAVSAVWNYYSTRQSILDMEKSQTEGCTKTVSSMLVHQGTAALYEDHKAEPYIYIRNAIRNFCTGFGQDELYLYTVDTAAKKRNVLMAVASDEGGSCAVGAGNAAPGRMENPVRKDLCVDVHVPGSRFRGAGPDLHGV